jgi:aspartyl-tRNA(Asn)/glutamyl-tRNA(Gln) amidotransferase subunit B
MSDWETVIGLETHVQLNTASKLFSPAPNRFGDEPNTNIAIVCTAQPGALPVLNREALRKAIQVGCALDAEVQEYSTWDRKSYFYPDSPRNFQITQFYEPIIKGGRVIAEVDGIEKIFSIEHAHLEDDAGMLKHFSSFAGVDYNRAGAPLLEIVSDPCIHSPAEAAAFGRALRAIMLYIGVSDCNMEEGSLRMDANISVRKRGETELRPKAEIKNMNSFRNMEMALESEVKRQIRLYERHPDQDPKEVMGQSTYRWDPEKGETVVMRTKEGAADYRYFPEPDLPPMMVTRETIEEIQASLPELPYPKRRRYVEQLGLSDYAAGVLTADNITAAYFEKALELSHEPQAVCNWITIEFAGRFKDTGKHLTTSDIPPEHVGELVKLIKEGTITGKIAKAVADTMMEHPGKAPSQIVKENPDFQPVTDTAELEAIIDRVMSDEAESVADFQSGKDRAFGFLMGQVMKATRGKANPKLVNELLKSKLKG